METFFDSVATLSEQELLDHFQALVDLDRRTTSELLVTIAEIDERKIWAKHGCSSMFTFCMERFHMSEPVTAKRLWAARTARRFPVILGMVESGELHLGAIHLLAGHLTADNHAQVLERAKHKSCRETSVLRDAGAIVSNAALAGCDQMASVVDQQPTAGNEGTGATSDWRSARTSGSRTRTKPIVALSPRRYKIEITVDEATHDKLRSLQDLLGRSATGRDPAAIISRAIDVLLDRTLARKAGCTARPKPAKGQRIDSISLAADAATAARRTIPAAVRREVWQRDGGRCCYLDARGRRCAATSNVEFRHRKPFGVGGGHTAQNIGLRCAAHNQYQADLDFGRSFMDGRRGRVANIPRGMSGARWRAKVANIPRGMSAEDVNSVSGTGSG